MNDKIIVWSDLSKQQREAIFDKHRKWLSSEVGGERAYLQLTD